MNWQEKKLRIVGITQVKIQACAKSSDDSVRSVHGEGKRQTERGEERG